MNEKYDVVKWLDMLLESEAGSLKRLAVSLLLQTLEGRSQLKKLWRENPILIKQTYHYLSEECLEKLRSGNTTAFIIYNKQEFYPLTQPCPFCDTPPDKLTWVFGNKHLDCEHSYFGIPDTWYVICDNCDLHLEAFSTEDTPPAVRIKRDKAE